MLNWSAIPVIYILLPLTAGILSAMWPWLVLIPIIIIISNWRTKRLAIPVVMHGLLFAFGHFIALDHSNRFEECRHLASKENTRTFRIQHIESSDNQSKLIAKEISSGCKCLIKLTGPTSIDFLPGDSLQVISELERPFSGQNPFEFDYRSWLEKQGVWWTTKAEMSSVSIHQCKNPPIGAWAYSCNQMLKSRLSMLIEHQEITNLLKAIILGDKSHLSSEVKTVFQQTGTMHIMAVSGLHVGMVAGILIALLPATNRRSTRLLQWAIKVMAIWIFVFVTGAKPSALRAAVMFTLFFTSRLLDRPGSAVNSLLAAGLVLSLIDPGIWLDIGFQFSFMAVLSILVFGPVIHSMLTPASTWMKWAWQIVSISLAVQVLLAPLSIFYFHSFPMSFLLGNLVAIPMAGGVMSLGICALAMTAISPEIALSLGGILEGFTELCLGLLTYLNQYSFLMINDLWPSKVCLIILYASVFFISHAFLLCNKRSYRIGLALLTILVLATTVEWQSKRADRNVIAYSWPHEGVIDFKAGEQLIRLSTKNDTTESTGFQSYHGLTAHTYKGLLPAIFELDTHSILVIDDQIPDTIPDSDILFFLNSTVIESSICEMDSWPQKVIAFSDAPDIIESLVSHCGIQWHNIKKDGAISIKLN